MASLLLLAGGLAVPRVGLADPEQRRPWDKVIKSEGCLALGTHSISHSTVRPWDCYYRATGPSMFVASTTNPFAITVSRNDGKKWVDLTRRSGVGPPTSGFLPTRAGDLVSVSISCWDYTTMRGCSSIIGGRHGTIVAHSEI